MYIQYIQIKNGSSLPYINKIIFLPILIILGDVIKCLTSHGFEEQYVV